MGTEEAAKSLGITRRAVAMAVERGDLPALKIGQRVLAIRPADVEAYRTNFLRQPGKPRPRKKKAQEDGER